MAGASASMRAGRRTAQARRPPAGVLPETLETTTNAKAQPIAFDLRGQARHVDLRRLPRDLKVPPPIRTSTPRITWRVRWDPA